MNKVLLFFIGLYLFLHSDVIFGKTLVLERESYGNGEVRGELTDIYGHRIAFTIEPSYPGTPKIYAGHFIAVRGIHYLGNGQEIETFEVNGIAGHSGLLFHPGRTKANSSGCILLGERLSIKKYRPTKLLRSKKSFKKFMGSLRGEDEFNLIVRDSPYTLELHD